MTDDLKRQRFPSGTVHVELALQLDLGAAHVIEEYPGQEEMSAMIYGGNATIYVSSMDKAVRFYTDVLGLALTNRFGNHWATVRAGKSLLIGLHPWREGSPAPGTKGAVQIGLVLSQDTRIEAFADRLRSRGVEVSDIIESEAGNYINFADPDGTPIYVGDWDPDFDAIPGESLEERLSRQEEEAVSAPATD